MANIFVNESMNNTIDQVINDIYTALSSIDKGIVKKYIVSLIEVMANIMGMNDTISDIIDINRNIFYQEKNKVLRWLMQYILPYINEANGKTRSNINNLSDIYVDKLEYIDINKGPPKYTYSNLQYGRCNRENFKDIKEIQFSEKHIRDNYYLLIDSLKECCHKMHVNWKDILPFTISDYEKTSLFINTKKHIEDNTIQDWDERDICNPDSFDIDKVCLYTKNLYIGTIYDTISNLIYENILPVKWMVYDIVYENDGDKGYFPLMQFFKFIFDCTPFEKIAINTEENTEENKYEKKYWNSTTDDIKQKFKNDWAELLHGFKNQIPPSYMTFSNFSVIVKSIIIGFNFGYSKIGLITQSKKPYIPLTLKNKVMGNEVMEYDEDTRFNELPNNLFYKTINSIQVEDMYDYFIESFNVYGQSIFHKIGLVPKDILPDGKEGKSNLDIIFTGKNFYSYCKSLVHHKYGDKFTRFPRYWKSLSTEQKQIFRNKLADKNNTNEWFNIKRYIKFVSKNRTRDEKQNIDTIEKSLYLYCNNNITKFIFEALIMSGTFTYYKPCLDISVQKTFFEEKKENPFWSGAYHYLTGTPYNLMQLAHYQEGYMSIFKYNSINSWHGRITMHWIAQIGLSNRFIQNRVNFLTGGTGVGKSTIIPMLYLYYMKSLCYKLNSKVVCTFPRIQPAEETAYSISASMGLPLFHTIDLGNGSKEKIFSETYYNVHLINSEKKHKNENPDLKLLCVTDGSLLMNLTQNPMLKTTGGTDKDDYTTRNMYDVVIVDEAHEHNANMDIILTLMRNISYHNNSITTVIMSATIDEDEPTYRRFYRDINDNRKYPLDRHIALDHPNQGTLDRINCDRRLHIADPDSGTRFPIKEFYYPPDTNPTELAIKLITQSTGYLLMFQPGQREIMENVNLINAGTSKDIIAFPFYARLGKSNGEDNNVLDVVKKLDNTLGQIKISKDKDIHLHGANIYEGSGSYNRCAIVATNIAEASITIDKLKIVIDTGKQKVNKFDRKTRTETLGTEGITESSRLQRKGRVGRTNPGEIHYIYEQGTMKNNRIQFGISIKDITFDILNLLQNTYNEQEFISADVDVNVPETLNIDSLKGLSRGYGKVIMDTYYIDEERYEYVGDIMQYDYNFHKKCPMYYETGYRYMRLLDPSGEFYIIHPDELIMIRNINGEIVQVLNKTNLDPDLTLSVHKDKMNTIKSEKIIVFFENLMRFMLITFDGNKSIKTEIGRYINQIREKLERVNIIDSKKTLLLLYGYVFGCVNEVMTYLALNSEINGDLRNKLFTYDVNSWKYNNQEIKNNISKKTSDILSLINLGNIIDSYFDKIGFPLNHRNEKYISQYSQDSQNIESISIIKKIIKSPEEYIESTAPEKHFSEYLKFVKKILYKHILDSSEILSKRLGITYKLIKNYCRNILDLRGMIDKLNIKSKSISSRTLEELGVILHPLTELIKTESLDDKITVSLLLANPYNLVKNINNTKNGYIDVINPRLISRKNCGTLNRNTYIPTCLMDNTYLKSYLYYDAYNTKTEEISLFHSIRPQFLSVLSHVIMPQEICLLKDMEYDNAKYTSWNDVSVVSNYTSTFEQIMDDVNRYHNNKIWKIIPKIDPTMKEYAEIMEKSDASPTSMIYGTVKN